MLPHIRSPVRVIAKAETYKRISICSFDLRPTSVMRLLSRCFAMSRV